MAVILIPTPLRKFTGNSAKVTIAGTSVAEIVSNLVCTYPEVQRHLLEPTGTIRQFINVFIEDEDIRNLQDQNTPVQENSVISLIPAISGGKY